MLRQCMKYSSYAMLFSIVGCLIGLIIEVIFKSLSIYWLGFLGSVLYLLCDAIRNTTIVIWLLSVILNYLYNFIYSFLASKYE